MGTRYLKIAPKIKRICRLCMVVSHDLKYYSAFGKYCELNIVDMIKTCYGIEVQERDRVSTLCEECLAKLDISFSIKKNVIEAEIKYNVLAEKYFTSHLFEDSVRESAENTKEGEKQISFQSIESDEIQMLDSDPLSENAIAEVVDTVDSVADKYFEEVLVKVEPDLKLDLLPKKRPQLRKTKRMRTSKRMTVKPKCNICNKIIDSNLELHLTSEHNDFPLICDKCENIKFSSIIVMNSHLGFHDEKRPFKCGYCFKRYWKRDSARNHEFTNHTRTCQKPTQKHHASTPKEENNLKACFQCTFCGKQFTTKTYLRVHENCVHTHEQKFPCPICDKVYGTTSKLKLHSRVHAGIKPYKCEHCDKHFSRRIYCLEHVRLHTGERPHSCSNCENKYRTRQGLMYHTKKCQHKQNSFTCAICNTIQSSFDDLKAHLAVDHPDSHFALDYNINDSEKPFECSDCGKTFKHLNTLQNHLYTTHIDGKKKRICNVCSKEFDFPNTLKRHMLVHTGVKAFKCNLCNRAFSQKEHLVTHMKGKHKN